MAGCQADGFGGQFGYFTEWESKPNTTGDPGPSLLLLTHRYYDPATGRFVNRDPIGYDGGINLYTFAGGNPVNKTDPDGQSENPGGGSGTVGFSFAAFIPDKEVSLAGVGFHGDNRGFSSNSTDFRLQQNFILDLKTQQITILPAQTGKTMVTSPGFLAGKTGKAPTNNIKVTVSKLGDSFFVVLSGSVSNPLVVGSPPIQYHIPMVIGKDGNVISIGGSHTQFPAFELWSYRNGRPGHILGYNPGKYGKRPFPDLYQKTWANKTDYSWSWAEKRTPP